MRARMEEIVERSIKSDRYSYFYDRTVDDELVWWHSSSGKVVAIHISLIVIGSRRRIELLKKESGEKSGVRVLF